MKTIQVQKIKLNPYDYVRRSAQETDYASENLLKESCILEYQGKPIVIYKRLDEEGFDSRDIVSALQRIEYHTNERTGGLKTTSRIFGYSPRNTIRKDFCSNTSLVHDFPQEHAIVCQYGAKVAALYAQAAPTIFQEHEKITQEKVLEQWRIKNSPFTSGIINKNNPLKYHFDSGNFTDVYSCMLGFKKHVAGGYLSLPEYDCALEIAHNSVLIFDGQSILHGVTPIKYLSPDAYRFTIVYYSLKRMWDCLPLSEEIIRIRNLKTQREIKRAKSNDDVLRAEAEAFKDVR